MGLFDENPKTEVPQETTTAEKRSIFDSGWSTSSGSGADEVQLSRFSVPALLVLLMGILSLLTFVYPTFIVAAWIALLAGIVVLISIRHAAVSVTGNGMALIGTSLAIVSLIVPALGQGIYEREKIYEAQQVVTRFTNLLSEGRVFDLLQMNHYASDRETTTNEVEYWNNLVSNEDKHFSLHTGFLSNPLLLLLYHLRDQVKYTYICTPQISSPKEGLEEFVLVYAATFTNAQGEKESLLFKVVLCHSWNAKEHEGYWLVSKTPELLSKENLKNFSI